VNATERAALLGGLELYDEMNATVDDRTLEILDHRRRTATVKRRGWLVRRVLLVADIAGLLAALALAEWVVNRHNNVGMIDVRAEILVFLCSLPLWVVIAKLYGLYHRDDERTDHSTADDFSGVFHMVTVCTFGFWVICYITGLAHPSAPKLIIFWAAAIGLITAARATARTLARRTVTYLQNTVIVGAGDVGQLVAKKILNHPEYGINLVGFVDDEPKERDDGLGHLALLGGAQRLPAVIRLFDVERVIVAFSNDSHQQTLNLVGDVKDLDVQIDIVPRLFETVGPNSGLHMIEGMALVSLSPPRLSWSSRVIKRSLDLCVSLGALTVLSPLLAIISLAIKVDTRGPVFYRHRRVGAGGQPIDVLKFRTMRLDACRGQRYGGEAAETAFEKLLSDPVKAEEFATTYKLADDPRVTRVGRFLRKTSLDELPQLLNVVAGTLSLVGPRAVTPDELMRYGDGVEALLSIRPGITGYWQINGRSRLSYEDRVRLDLSYIAGWSLRLDLEILAKTLRVILSGQGAA
jgi:exopolysaccharide biosynthesis polyprenyl glycosylphosphotransferase